jgi:hypothetical protein
VEVPARPELGVEPLELAWVDLGWAAIAPFRVWTAVCFGALW